MKPSRYKQVIAAVQAWQASDMVHPLTCTNDSSHAPLQPVKVARRVILKCPDCDYEQTEIPALVIEMGPRLPKNSKRPAKGPIVPPITVPFDEAVTRLMKVKPPKKRTS